jgi:flagellar motor switch protein FliM
MSEFLSQDEVDSLLKGVTGEADDAPADAGPAAGEVRPYNLASQERIVRGRMPTMEIINNVLRGCSVSDYLTSSAAHRRFRLMVRVLKFGDHPQPACTHQSEHHSARLRGNGLFIFDPNRFSGGR